MKKLMFEGRTESEALEMAAMELNLKPEDIQYRVVSRVGKLLGLMGKKIKIEVDLEDHIEEDRMGGIDEAEKLEARGSEEALVYEVEDDLGSYEMEEDELEEMDETDHQKEPVVPSEYAEKAARTLGQILRLMGLEGEITTSDMKRTLVLDIQTESGGLIIGRKGQTLDALQFLMNRMMKKFQNDSTKKILLDVGGFKTRKRDSLVTLAKKLGNKAKKMNKVIYINPMSSQDRKVIHLTLSKMKGVKTRSEGNGIFRRLLIIPDTGEESA